MVDKQNSHVVCRKEHCQNPITDSPMNRDENIAMAHQELGGPQPVLV